MTLFGPLRSHRTRYALLVAGFAATATPLMAQDATSGRLARSAVGEVGQRQTRAEASAQGLAPTARLQNRIRNRIQSRLDNRIDRNFSPQENASAVFEAATQQAVRR